MIDQSGSMSEPYGPDSMRSKAEVVADVCNNTLSELVARCRDGSLWRHYFDIGVVGYSGRGVYSLLPGGAWLLNPAQLAASALDSERVEQTHRTPDGSLITLHSLRKIWIKAVSDGKTPMHGAFSKLLEIVSAWRASQRSLHIFPPTIVNITDGQPTDASDGSILELADRIRMQGTADGEPIIFNIHISSENTQSVSLPSHLSELPLEAELLYNLSSTLPDSFKNEIQEIRVQLTSRRLKAMAYNAGVEELISVMNIGSSTISSQR